MFTETRRGCSVISESELLSFGITDDLREFVKGLTSATFQAFPEQANLEIEIRIMPASHEKRRFWRIHFTLVSTHVAPYERKYMEELRNKAESKDEEAKKTPTVGGTKTAEKNRTSTEHDPDTFLLGDLEDSDEGPGETLTCCFPVILMLKKRKRRRLKHKTRSCNEAGKLILLPSSLDDLKKIAEQSEESEDAAAEVSEDDNDSVSEGEEEDEFPAADVNDDEDDSDADAYRGRFEKTWMQYGLEEPPEEEEENYILGCMIKCKSVYKCRYCPHIICLNERTMQEHVSSKKHARSEKLMKEEKLRTDDGDEFDDPEKPSQIKGNRRSQRKGKRSQKQGKLRTDPEAPSQEKQVKGNRKTRRQANRSQKQEKGSSTTDGEKTDATLKSRKKMRQTKD